MRRQCSELKYTVLLYHNVKNIFYIFKDGTLYSLNVTTKLIHSSKIVWGIFVIESSISMQ
jgi:hypothetical protein